MKLPEIIRKMDQLRDELDSLRPITEDRLNRLNQKLRLDWNYHSNSIEGNTLSASETRAFIIHGITAEGKPFRDYVEMQGHDKALKKLEDIVHHELKITEKLIKEFHKIILVEPYDSEAEINPGEYKTQPNYLISTTNERIDFEPPQEVSKLMNDLINWLNNHIDPPKRKRRKYDLHPLLIASGFHVRFIQIHPFGDGNGRMARILMNLILMLCGYVPAIIKLEKRKEYYTALNLSTLDHMEPLAEFVGLECLRSLEMAIKAAKGESIEEDDDLDKKLAMLTKELDAEDGINDIKTQLSFEILNQQLNTWLFDLINDLITTTNKFSSYYLSSNHYIDFQISNLNRIFNLNEPNVFDKFKKYWEEIYSLSKYTITQNCELKFGVRFIGYKKGGVDPFDCNYNFEIKYEQYRYEILVDRFDVISNSKIINSFTKKLLHKHLLPEEIKEINTQWGETLFNHLEYYRKRQNGNDKI